MSPDDAKNVRTSAEDEKGDANASASPELSTVEPVQPASKSTGLFSRFGRRNPPPPPGSLDDAPLSPEATAGFLSRLAFAWIWPLMSLGYSRPLEATDLWRMSDDRSASVVAAKIDKSFQARLEQANQFNKDLAAGVISPSALQRAWWTLLGKREVLETQWRESSKRTPSLAYSLNDAVTWWFWSAGILKIIADCSQTFSPLVVRALITFATESYVAHLEQITPPSIGKGVGFAILLIAMQLINTLCSNHFNYRAASSGVLLRGGLINAIYTRSLRFTTRSRAELPTGKLTNFISTDVSRIDAACLYFHMAYAAPIQLVICIGLLIHNLGASALAGLGFFIFASLPQGVVIMQLLSLRKKVVVWTDKRARLLQELFSSMRLVKQYNWEGSFIERVDDIRGQELSYVRALIMVRSLLMAMIFTLPTLASIVAFITYSGTGHDLNAAVLFSSLSLFQIVQTPLTLLPVAMASLVDASNALSRVSKVFTAELVTEPLSVNGSMADAINVKDASFTWDAAPPAKDSVKEEEEAKASDKDKKAKAKERKREKKTGKDAAAEVVEVAEPVKEEAVFELKDINLTVPRGQLVMLVGSVGSGKSSLLQALVGEMRRTAGSVDFGGSVAYCSQVPWIQNATIRDNICFGRPFESERYWKAVNDACLNSDLDVLPNGDMTEVGEKGIQLSGGQKQRINICRAIYSDADILIFDDPLSALDAHVGEQVFERVLADSSSGKARLLVTHALHFLQRADYVYTLSNGRIDEHGTYDELVGLGGTFSKLVGEFVSDEQREAPAEVAESKVVATADTAQVKRKDGVEGDALMQEEERNTGAVSWSIYRTYLRAGNGWYILPVLVLFLLFEQGANIVGAYWLVWWQDRTFDQPNGFYMGVYAALGLSQSFTAFLVGVVFAWLSYAASRQIHNQSLRHVLYAPMSFFETTPLGRIMNRFSKDVDTLDDKLVFSIRALVTILMGMIGGVVLICIVLPYFLAAVAAIAVLYGFVSVFYRSSAREVKRLEAILRSSVYAHFNESISGIGTIRAYGAEARFCAENNKRINVENRAYWLTVTNQRWLALWLDVFGVALTTVVAFLVVGTRFRVVPAQTGLVLSYVVGLQASLAFVITLFAEVENDMNSVERLVHYATNIEQEPAHSIPERAPVQPWPAAGALEFKDIVFKYRPELPAVLKNVNLSVAPGEKIGFVGRTGAGKTSLLTTLFRIVELTSGSIEIDGVDISTIGLSDLRKNIAIIPQDSMLFAGTLRYNLDPFGVHDDAQLWDALRRAYVVDAIPNSDDAEKEETAEKAPEDKAAPARFTLDSTIDDEGGNVSIGQRSLIALARALVKNSRVLVLDEATASVDYATDRRVQDTLLREFADRTVLVIAHRLRTVVAYDRVCVLEKGEVAELGPPAELYAQGGIFRGMCERSGIVLEDIVRAAEQRRAIEAGAA